MPQPLSQVSVGLQRPSESALTRQIDLGLQLVHLKLLVWRCLSARSHLFTVPETRQLGSQHEACYLFVGVFAASSFVQCSSSLHRVVQLAFFSSLRVCVPSHWAFGP